MHRLLEKGLMSCALRQLKNLQLDCFSWFGLLQQKYRTLGGFNNRNLYLTVWEPGKSEVKMPGDPGSGEGPLPGVQMATLSLNLQMVEKENKSSRICLYKGINTVQEAPPLQPDYFPKAHLTLPPHWSLRFQHMNLGGIQKPSAHDTDPSYIHLRVY